MKSIKLTIVILLFSCLVYSQTNVSGTISTNTTWTLANSPYIITDDVLVDIGVILTIEAGVTVKVESGKKLQNKGTLIAVGTSGNEIVFTSNQATPTEGYWSSIEFFDETEDATFDGNGDYISGTIIEYANVLYGGGSGVSGAVIMTNSAIYINNVTVQYSASKGIYLNKSIGGTVPVIKIKNSTIADNSSIGVYCDCYQYNVSITVDSSVIKNNVGGGISTGGGDAGGSHTFIFTNNTVDNNDGTGINGNANGTQTITGNIVNNNTGLGIRTRGNGTYTIQNNIVTNNSLVGIHGIYTTHIIDNNIIAMNGGGIEISQGGNYTITDNQIYSNSRLDGAAFYPAGWSPPVTMERNTITSNTSSNVGSGTILTFQPSSGDPSFVVNQNNIFGNTSSYELKNNRLITLSNIDADNNWWGTITDLEIQAKIYDWNDDGTLGIVDYDPYLTSPDIDAPISPPTNVVKSTSGSDVQLSWSANPESDLTGYKVYWGSPTGYSFANVVDVGNVTSYTITGISVSDDIAVTAYDNQADGTDDQVEGHESWFAYGGDPTPIMVLSAPSLDFGVVAVGQSDQRTLSIQNNGSADLIISNITSSNTHYTVTPTSFTVSSGGSQTVTVEFAPSTTGIESGELSITHNASGSPSTVTLMGVGSTSSGTGVSGIISTNTTWTLANSPYIITDDVLVDIGVILTIEAGVTVKVESRKKLQNKGTLIAVGTSGNEIVFTSNQATPTEGYWSSIEFFDETEDATFDGNGEYISGTIIEYANVLYGGSSGVSGAVIMTNSAIYINNLMVQYSASKGIYLNKSIGGTVPVIKIENSTITDNSSIGVYCDCYQYNVSITVDSSVIKNNVGGGISTGGGDAGGSHTFIFTNNTVDNNDGTGINGNANGTQTITGNIVNNNTGLGIRTRGNGTYTIQNNIVTNNSLVGIHGIYTTHIIDNNIIAMNGGGIEISQGGDYTITDNQIYSNSRSDGAAFDPVGGTEQGAWSPPVTMERNTITSNTSSNVGSGTILTFQPSSGDPSFVVNQNNIFGNTSSYELKNNRLITLSNIDADNNWWGTITDLEIQAKIYDWNDDGTLGIVDYVPYLTSPDIDAPISSPTNVVKSASGSDVQLSWSANPESDLAGYKVYYGSPTGYSFANVVDVGNITSYTLSGVSLSDDIAVTAYDNLADGTDDQVEGHESWFAYAGEQSLNISEINDVPDDQGRWVFLSWFAIGLDSLGDITQYGIWELNPESEWVSLGNVPAIQEEEYIYLAHTFGDSADEGIFWSTFMVTAHTTNPEVFYTSAVDSGYSIDNLAPAVPTGLLASVTEENAVKLRWDEPVDEDFQYFKIYRSLEPDFDPTGMEPFAETIDTTFIDSDTEIGETYYYILSAVDFNGNESEYTDAVEAAVLSTAGVVGIPTEFALHQNYPNPFNPVTTLRYDLPEQSFVRITIYDILGREVRYLVNRIEEPGFKSVVWDATNANGRPVSAGVYLYRISSDKFTKVNKMILLR